MQRMRLSERILNEYFRERKFISSATSKSSMVYTIISDLETLTGEFRYWSAMGIICMIQRYRLLMEKVKK